MNRGQIATYSYDLKNRLTSVVQPSETTSFTYTGNGMRRSKITGASTTNYLYDGISTIRETDGSGGTIANYTTNPTSLVGQITSRTDNAGQQSFYSFDDLGSTRNLTDQSQSQTAGYSYDAFGNVLDHTGQNATYTFSTKEQDTTGLYYFAARYYDPEIGRFTTQDPVPANLYDPQSLNRYVYCDNDPINLVDPLGLFSMYTSDPTVNEFANTYEREGKCGMTVGLRGMVIIGQFIFSQERAGLPPVFDPMSLYLTGALSVGIFVGGVLDTYVIAPGQRIFGRIILGY